jgi:hypothetical protein
VPSWRSWGDSTILSRDVTWSSTIVWVRVADGSKRLARCRQPRVQVHGGRVHHCNADQRRDRGRDFMVLEHFRLLAHLHADGGTGAREPFLARRTAPVTRENGVR